MINKQRAWRIAHFLPLLSSSRWWVELPLSRGSTWTWATGCWPCAPPTETNSLPSLQVRPTALLNRQQMHAHTSSRLPLMTCKTADGTALLVRRAAHDSLLYEIQVFAEWLGSAIQSESKRENPMIILTSFSSSPCLLKLPWICGLEMFLPATVTTDIAQ